MNTTKKVTLNFVIILILAGGIWFRLTQYGNLRLSVAMPDTSTFITSASAPFLSFEDFSSRRLFTTNLLYRLSQGEECANPEISSPYDGKEIERSIYKCFSSIVLIQNLLSVIGWSLLALTTAKWIKTPIYKIAAMAIILSFGFSPQIAEWDSVLSSEALSISLLTLVIALLQEIAFGVAFHKNHPEKNKTTGALIIVWTLVFLLWCFVRDVQLYAIIGTLILTIPLLYFQEIRQIKLIIPVLTAISLVFVLGTKTAQASDRWQPSIEHALTYHVLPYPSRVEAMMNRGMPSPQAIEEFKAWLNTRANKDYGVFLITHPGFIVSTIFDLSGYLNSDFLQPYFTMEANKLRDKMLVVGEMFHPQTNAVYLISLLLVFSLTYSAITLKDRSTMAWAWLASWIFVYSSVSLILSLFGDTDGTRRHIYPSVELFRLSNWLFLIVHFDLVNQKFQTSKSK
ncbi:MAG: hypothetical protein IH588_15935 [Anaerolineales bacterium]|nr:hypothetical protein [Anaerolineales bacterium]